MIELSEGLSLLSQVYVVLCVLVAKAFLLSEMM